MIATPTEPTATTLSDRVAWAEHRDTLERVLAALSELMHSGTDSNRIMAFTAINAATVVLLVPLQAAGKAPLPTAS